MELAKYTASLGSIAFSFITSLSEAQFYKSDSHFFKWRECMSKKILSEKVYVIISFDLIVKSVLINEDYLCE